MKANRSDAASATRFASAAAAAEDLLEARAAFLSAVRLTPQPDAEQLAGLGSVEQRLGLCREALATYTQLVDRFPLDNRGYLGRSQALDLLGRHPEAVNALDAALGRLPVDDISGRTRVVEQIESFGDVARALHEAEANLARSPESADALLLTTHLQIKAERPDRALPLLQRLLAREPANARARYQLGVVLDSAVLPSHSSALAEDALLTAIERSPSETPAYRRLIEMYEQQGRYRQAAYVSLQLLALMPDSAEARLHLSYAYRYLNDEAGSAEQGAIAAKLLERDRETARLTTEIRQNPEDAEKRLAFARHSLRYGRVLDALGACDAAYALSPSNGTARRELLAISKRLKLPPPAGLQAD
jgi:tetratricopeptide (TPR) repeat protein